MILFLWAIENFKYLRDKKMLSIYASNLRPQPEVDAIVSATASFPERNIKKWQKIPLYGSDYVHVLHSGEIELRRTSDDLSMFTIRKQLILGISAMFYDSEHTYAIARTNAVICSIKKEDFIQLITEKNLWPQLTKVLSWYICAMGKRDDILIARSAYSVVREFLLEIHELMANHNRDINIYDYIQEYTNLARSTIIKILSDLKKGHYIVVEKGKLVSLNSLPERY